MAEDLWIQCEEIPGSHVGDPPKPRLRYLFACEASSFNEAVDKFCAIEGRNDYAIRAAMMGKKRLRTIKCVTEETKAAARRLLNPKEPADGR